MAITKIQSESLNLADTYAFTGTVTGAGSDNKPYFAAVLNNGLQSVSSNTLTKCTFNSVLFDTASGWDSSNNRWTVPSGEGGKYFSSGILEAFSGSNNISKLEVQLKVNDSNIHMMQQETGSQRHVAYAIPVIKNLSAGDYVELFGKIVGTSPNFRGDVNTCSLNIFKIAE